MNQEEIDLFIRNQEMQIVEIRERMGRYFRISKSAKILSLGEGTEYQNTFIGYCLEANLVPGEARLAVVVDRKFLIGSYMGNPGICRKDDLLILPVKADVTRLPFSKEYFDICISCLMIDDCPDREGMLKEMCRCTAPGGIIMLSGHGIDITSELKGICGVYGAGHKYQTRPEDVDKLISGLQVEIINRWGNEHAWLRILRKK